MQTRKQKFLDCFEQHYLIWTFAISLFAALINIGIFYYLNGAIFYTDTDCYTRALRMTDWLRNFDWPEKMFPFFNPPNGFVLHFTRICDVIWAALTAPLLPFLPLKEAVFYGGLLFSPFFMGLTLVAILWGIKPYLPTSDDNKTTLLIVLATLLFYAVKLNDVFDAVRPDHHALMCFVFCFCIASILRCCQTLNFQTLFWAGIFSGCGVWASSAPDGFFVILISLLLLAVNWIFYKQTIQTMFWYILGVFLSIAVAWLINPPYGGYAAIDVHRLSVVHVVLTGLMTMVIGLICLIDTKRKTCKLLLLSTSALTVGCLMIWLYGVAIWLQSPITPELWKYCFKYVGELRSLSLLSYETPSILLSFITLGGLFALYKPRQYLVNLLILTLLTFAITMFFWRFYSYLMMTFLFLCGLLLFELLYKAQKSLHFKWISFFYLLIPMLVTITFYMQPTTHKVPTLNGTALLDTFDVPKTVFEQNIDAVGGPYHTNIEGIEDNHLMWFADNEVTLKKLLVKHQIHTVYLQPDTRPNYYVSPEKNTDKFYGKIMSGHNIYDWLKRIDTGHYEINFSRF